MIGHVLQRFCQKPFTSDTAENFLQTFTSPFPGNKFTHFITEADKNVCVS